MGGLLKIGLLAVLALVSAPSPVQATGTDEKARGFWMAASGAEPVFTGRSRGRLILEDGQLTFRSADYEWRLTLSEIKRVDESKVASKVFEVESFSGAIYFVAILDAKMLTDSPRKAVQTIQGGVREAPTTSRQVLGARDSR